MTAWHETADAQALIAALKAERPDCWYLKRFAWDECRYPRYKGFTARSLRQLWETERMAAIDANDRERYIALGEAHPDDLIERVLGESAGSLVDVEHLGPGRIAA